jgi:hypothetical protein
MSAQEVSVVPTASDHHAILCELSFWPYLHSCVDNSADCSSLVHATKLNLIYYD